MNLKSSSGGFMSDHPTFVFQDQQIRMLVENGQPWFVSKDVCAVLGIDWSGKTLSNIPDKWQSMGKLPTLRRGTQNIRLISEAGLYKLAFRSNKPQADAFTNWVASEVLPAIRKTGKYAVQPEPEPQQKPKQKALPREKPKALPPATGEVDALLGKVRFFIGEIADLEKRITGIMTAEYLRRNPDAPATMQDSRYAHNLYLSCSAGSLWQSVDFALKAIEESIKLRLHVGA